MHAKKSLGQHFLQSKDIAKTLCRAGEIKKDELVVEIGPGRGILTDALLEEGACVEAVEKDHELTTHLREIFEREVEKKNLRVVEADILHFKPPAKPYKLIANIPYYITGEILRKFLSTEHQPTLMVLMVQKEVAERIVKDEKGSLLSTSVKVYGTPSIVRTVKPGSFNPPPKIESAILRISNISKSFFMNQKIDEREFFELLRLGFGQKRKQLSSNLLS